MNSLTVLEKIALTPFLETFEMEEFSFQDICQQIMAGDEDVVVWPNYAYLTPHALVGLITNHLDYLKVSIDIWLIPLEEALTLKSMPDAIIEMRTLKAECHVEGNPE